MTSVGNHPNLVNLVGACSVDGESDLKVEQSRYSSLYCAGMTQRASLVSSVIGLNLIGFKTIEMGGSKTPAYLLSTCL